MNSKFTITLPIDHSQFRDEEQLHHTNKIGIDFGDEIDDFACCVIIEKSEKGLIIKTMNQIHRINVFRENNKNNKIEIRTSEA